MLWSARHQCQQVSAYPSSAPLPMPCCAPWQALILILEKGQWLCFPCLGGQDAIMNQCFVVCPCVPRERQPQESKTQIGVFVLQADITRQLVVREELVKLFDRIISIGIIEV